MQRNQDNPKISIKSILCPEGYGYSQCANISDKLIATSRSGIWNIEDLNDIKPFASPHTRDAICVNPQRKLLYTFSLFQGEMQVFQIDETNKSLKKRGRAGWFINMFRSYYLLDQQYVTCHADGIDVLAAVYSFERPDLAPLFLVLRDDFGIVGFKTLKGILIKDHCVVSLKDGFKIFYVNNDGLYAMTVHYSDPNHAEFSEPVLLKAGSNFRLCDVFSEQMSCVITSTIPYSADKYEISIYPLKDDFTLADEKPVPVAIPCNAFHTRWQCFADGSLLIAGDKGVFRITDLTTGTAQLLTEEMTDAEYLHILPNQQVAAFAKDRTNFRLLAKPERLAAYQEFLPHYLYAVNLDDTVSQFKMPVAVALIISSYAYTPQECSALNPLPASTFTLRTILSEHLGQLTRALEKEMHPDNAELRELQALVNHVPKMPPQMGELLRKQVKDPAIAGLIQQETKKVLEDECQRTLAALQAAFKVLQPSPALHKMMGQLWGVIATALQQQQILEYGWARLWSSRKQPCVLVQDRKSCEISLNF